MTDKVKLKEEVVRIVRSILISAGDGLTVNKVLKDYYDVIGEELPYRNMGYVEPDDFFLDIPDAARVSYRFGNMLIRGVSNRETAHIEQMKAREKPRRTRGVGGFSRVDQPPSRRKLRHPNSTSARTGGPSHPPPQPLVSPFIRANILNLLYSYPSGLLGSSFATAFARRYGHELNFMKLGFNSLGDLLRSLTDIIDIEQLPGGGTRFHARARKGQQSRNRGRLSDPAPRPVLSHQPLSRRPVLGMPAGYEDEDELDLAVDDHGDHGPSPPSSVSPTQSQSTGSISISKFFEDDGNISDELKKTVQGILESHPDGVWAASFQDKYRRVTGDQLPIKRLGYTSMIEFMAELSDIVSIERPNDGDWLLFDARTYQPSDKPAVPAPLRHEESSSDWGSSREALGSAYATPTLDLLLKETIRQVVAYHPDGVHLGNIENKFKALTGKDIPVKELGFPSIDTLVCSAMSDTLELQYKAGGELIVTALNKNIPRDHLLINAPELAETSSEVAKHKCMSRMPVDAVGPGIGYTVQKLPKKTEFREVFVSNINSPGNFWLQLKGVNTTETLEVLMDKLEEVYYGVDADRYNMPDEMVKPGQVCVAVYPHDDNWHRGYITNIKDLDFVEVYYFDYGNTGSVPRNGIKLMRNCFMSLPAQAIPARLANIAPLDGKRWDSAAGRRMLDLVSNRPLIALITHVSKDDVLSVCLTDTSGEDDIHINDILVNETLARFQPDDEIMEADETVADDLAQVIEENSARQRYLEEITVDQPAEPLVERTPSPIEIKRFVRRYRLGTSYRLHVINFQMQPFAVSGDVSALFWRDDILRSQLRRKKLNIDREVIAKADHEQIFIELASYQAKGVIDSEGEIKPHITIYNVHSIIHLLDIFDHPQKAEMTDCIENLLTMFDPQDNYWLVPPPEETLQMPASSAAPQASMEHPQLPAPAPVQVAPSAVHSSSTKPKTPSPERKSALCVKALTDKLNKLQMQPEPAQQVEPHAEAEPELSLEELKGQLQKLQAQRKAMLQKMMQESDSMTSSLSVEELNVIEGEMTDLRERISKAQKARPADETKKTAAALGKAAPQKMAIVQPQQSPQRPSGDEKRDQVKAAEKAKPQAPSSVDVMAQLSAIAASTAQATGTLSDQTQLLADDLTGPSTRELQEALEANERLLQSVLMNQAQLMSQGYLPQGQAASQGVPQSQQPGYPVQPASQAYQQPMPAYPSSSLSSTQLQAGLTVYQPGYSQPSQVRGAGFARSQQYATPSQPTLATAYTGATLYPAPQGPSQQLDPSLMPTLNYIPQSYISLTPQVNLNEAMHELNYMSTRSGHGRGAPRGMVPVPKPGSMYPR